MSGEAAGLKRAIKLRNAVALYASFVLGSGILVLPGLAARIVGPGSIRAWIFTVPASYPFAFTFATLSVRRPESGGVYSFPRKRSGCALQLLWDGFSRSG